MTAATEHVQPNPQDPQPPVVVASTDPDEIELAQALALAKAEEAGEQPPAGQAQPNGGTQAQQPAAPGPKDQPQPGAQPEGVMIPKARFDEVLARATKAEQEAAYQRGLAEGRQPAAPAPGQPGGQQPAAATPEQRLAAIGTEIDALATKFDNGEITMADYKKQERALDDKRLAIRDEGLVARVKPAETSAVADNALYLDNLTAQLEDAHPWVNVLQQVGTDHDWAYLKALATDGLIARGIDPTQNTTIVSYELRKEIAQLADTMGPGLLTARAQAKGIALPGQEQQQQQQQQQPAGGKPAPTPNAAARAAKLALAANAPPNLNNMTGTPGAPGVDVSDTTVEGMTDEAIGALPAAARNRILGTTSG